MVEMPLDGGPPLNGWPGDFEVRNLMPLFRWILNKNDTLRYGSYGTRLQRHYIETGIGSDK